MDKKETPAPEQDKSIEKPRSERAHDSVPEVPKPAESPESPVPTHEKGTEETIGIPWLLCWIVQYLLPDSFFQIAFFNISCAC